MWISGLNLVCISGLFCVRSGSQLGPNQQAQLGPTLDILWIRGLNWAWVSGSSTGDKVGPILKCIFKLTHKQLPQYFEQFTFTFRNQLHNYATRTCQNVLIPNINHEFAKRSIRFIAPAAYNSTHGNIIDKIYSHSFVGFCIYVKFKLLESHNSVCTISNCFSCRINIQ